MTWGKNRLLDKDLGYKKLLKRLVKTGAGQTISLGVFDDDPLQVIKAAVHEFGAKRGHVPQRRWLSKFWDTHAKDIADIVVKAQSEAFFTGASVEAVMTKHSDEVFEILMDFVVSNTFPPPLSDFTLAAKTTPYQFIETGAMIGSVAIKYSPTKPGGGSKGKVLAKNSGGGAKGGRRTGRPKSLGLLKHLKALYTALLGSDLYEGYGQRKRPAAKTGTSTTVKWPSGYKRMPTRSPKGRYPSDSRPKGN
jgi:hypothetical protein